MRIVLNGETKEVADGVSISGLLDAFGIRRDGIAVDVNREIVPKRLHGQSFLKEGDVVEVVRMVGGG